MSQLKRLLKHHFIFHQKLLTIGALNMENVYTVSKTFLTTIKFLGFFPLSFEGPARKGFLKVKWYNFINVSCLIAFSIFISVLLSKRLFFVFNDSSFIDEIWNSLMRLENFSYFGLFTYQMFRIKNTVKFLKLLYSFDEIVRIIQP